jgi:hypothetical protein
MRDMRSGAFFFKKEKDLLISCLSCEIFVVS